MLSLRLRHVEKCQLFENPKFWVECLYCSERLGIDLKGYLESIECPDYFELEFLDLAAENLNLRRWRKTFKSKFFLQNYPLAKQQLDAFGLLDVIVEKFDYYYMMDLHFTHKFLVETGVMILFIEYLTVTTEAIGTPGFDVSLSIRKILQLIRRIKIFQINEHVEYLGNAVHCLWPALIGHCQGDSELVVDFIKTVFGHLDYQKKIFTYMDDSKDLEFLMEHANAQKFDFWGLYSRERIFTTNPADVCLEEDGCLESVRVMMKYGYRHGLRPLSHLLSILGFYYNEISYDGYEFLDILYTSDLERLYLNLLLLATFKKRPRTKEDIELVKLVYSDSSLAFLTLDQLRYFIKRIIQAELLPEFLTACSEYQVSTCFGVSYNEDRPRCLKHLSRVAVRELLRVNHQLPHGVKELCLPESLQHYVNLNLTLL